MKWAGKIGFSVSTETSPGVWEDRVIERRYTGDVLYLKKDMQPTDSSVENVLLQNGISIVADPFANSHLANMIYATYGGAKWRIKNVTTEYPRLSITFGGVYK